MLAGRSFRERLVLIAQRHGKRRENEYTGGRFFLLDHIADESHRFTLQAEQLLGRLQPMGSDGQLEQFPELEIGHTGRWRR